MPRVGVVLLGLLVVLLSCALLIDVTEAKKPRKVKVFVITMFDAAPPLGAETLRWIQNEGLTEELAVPGLSPSFPVVHCRPPARGEPHLSDVCAITTDMCYSNAATSMMALVFSDLFDLTDTYFLVAGIAGVDPLDGTLGSAAWARYVVDFGLAHHIDSREAPPDWPSGWTGFGPVPPGVFPTRWMGTEVYRLNEELLQKALQLTHDLDLTVNDSPDAINYRALYANAPANAPPKVIQCDSVAVDTYWHGAVLSQRANEWAALLTNGSANYCMTDQEDAATMTALQRGHLAGLVDFNRVAVLRTASNFDQPHPSQTPWQSLNTRSGGFIPSLKNAYYVGSVLVHEIVDNWRVWRRGVPLH